VVGWNYLLEGKEAGVLALDVEFEFVGSGIFADMTFVGLKDQLGPGNLIGHVC